MAPLFTIVGQFMLALGTVLDVSDSDDIVAL
jgi:hypothetical protein